MPDYLYLPSVVRVIEPRKQLCSEQNLRTFKDKYSTLTSDFTVITKLHRIKFWICQTTRLELLYDIKMLI